MIEGTAEPVALPAPEAQFREATPEPTQKRKTNRLMRDGHGGRPAGARAEQAMKRGRRDCAFALVKMK